MPFLSCGQNQSVVNDTVLVVKDSIPVIKDSIVETWHYGCEITIAWDKVDSAWLRNAYWDCLKKFKIKLDCGHCIIAVMDVDMKIDSSGKLEEYRIIKSRICTDEVTPDQEKCFMEYFTKLIFPAEFRGKTIRVKLGDSLKC